MKTSIHVSGKHKIMGISCMENGIKNNIIHFEALYFFFRFSIGIRQPVFKLYFFHKHLF